MATLLYILAAVFLISVISLVGILTLGIRKKRIQKAIAVMVSFAAGALIAAALLDLLPKAVELSEELGLRENFAFYYFLSGIVLFFIIERFLYWYHFHNHKTIHHKKHVAPFTYLNIIGDGIHNFTDGAIVAAGFMTSTSTGLITTLAVIFHEIPQEISDFAILIHGGFSRTKALLFNFLSAITAIIGALIVYFSTFTVEHLEVYLLPIAAGGFIYLACTDLIPEIHRTRDLKEAIKQFTFFLIGIGVIWLVTSYFHH